MINSTNNYRDITLDNLNAKPWTILNCNITSTSDLSTLEYKSKIFRKSISQWFKQDQEFMSFKETGLYKEIYLFNTTITKNNSFLIGKINNIYCVFYYINNDRYNDFAQIKNYLDNILQDQQVKFIKMEYFEEFYLLECQITRSTEQPNITHFRTQHNNGLLQSPYMLYFDNKILIKKNADQFEIFTTVDLKLKIVDHIYSIEYIEMITQYLPGSFKIHQVSSVELNDILNNLEKQIPDGKLFYKNQITDGLPCLSEEKLNQQGLLEFEQYVQDTEQQRILGHIKEMIPGFEL